EAGVNRHDENEVQLVHDVVQPVQGRGRVQHQPGLAAVLADQAEGAVDVLAGLGVEADDVRARLGEVGHDAVHGLHHEVHVDHRAGERPDGLAHHGPDGEVG